ncbi:polysaccharide deacetylase family protein [Algoriphagus halophytocola]|uniref:Polysaccharide deacetylase family protein n=1 Tax=Algoriphagus halophytocola TaxID=2991499 RepID=A0ABY6MN88_9BACT|nr:MULTISPECIES: polysaccharide deacetylase family protein [unclassified Algoriphagus]UZD24151.1 polysaccharide deacetylase family protein [Algoriphagus sp. TR-M5]WBL41522.1 polysaccharide deacetylase family protein [Algoriphagus sp. TR-M9]
MKSSLFYTAFLILIFLNLSCTEKKKDWSAHTQITKWPEGKTGAVSITYDDGIINQLTIAKPIMDSLGLPATFFIITGKVEGSAQGKFIGRDPESIISETASVKTDSTNFFERASLIAFTGTSEAELYHANVGALYEAGKIAEAYALLDEGYEKIRKGRMKDTEDVAFHNNPVDTTTWEQYKSYQKQGHEISSHTVTHPRLAVLDEANMRYELEQSKADLAKFMGEESTFSAEGPYGTENERVMEYAHKIYPALRNRMPEDWLAEINRSSKQQPGASSKEYVQWQRGALSHTSIEQMKAWTDTVRAHDNIWLVLVIHGVEDYGWEPIKRDELVQYFADLKENEEAIWIGTFGDVTKYLRERKATKISSTLKENEIRLHLESDLDASTYNVPLSFKTYLPEDWNGVSLVKESGNSPLKTHTDHRGKYVSYSVPFHQTQVVLISAE